MSRAGEVVTREQLMDEVWDENWFGPTKTLDVHVFALRRSWPSTARGLSGSSRCGGAVTGTSHEPRPPGRPLGVVAG